MATASSELKKALHPSRFSGISPKMAAIVQYILKTKGWVRPRIQEIRVTSDGYVLAEHEGEVGANHFLGHKSELKDNWNRLLDAAGISDALRKEANRWFMARIHESHPGHESRMREHEGMIVNPGMGMPGMPHTWVAPDGSEIRAGDVVAYWRTEGLPHGAKPVRSTGTVLRYLIFDDHVQVKYGSFGATVDAGNFIRKVRSGRRGNPDRQTLMWKAAGQNIIRGHVREAQKEVNEILTQAKDYNTFKGVGRARELLVAKLTDAFVDFIADTRQYWSIPFPSPKDVRRLVRSIWTDSGHIGIRERPRPKDGNDERVMLRQTLWHLGQGSASLGGVLAAWHDVGSDRWDEIDSVASAVIIILTGGMMKSHSETWRRSVHGR